MALEHAILVSLAERSASGYDLARRFDASIGHFWKASHQQIYKVLGRMDRDGWVAAELVAQDARPDKKVYVITGDGRRELNRWTSTATPEEPLRSVFAVKIRALPYGDASAIVENTRARRHAHLGKLAFYEDSAARHYPHPDELRDDELGGWLALRGGILGEQAGIAWCDEILQRLRASDELER